MLDTKILFIDGSSDVLLQQMIIVNVSKFQQARIKYYTMLESLEDSSEKFNFLRLQVFNFILGRLLNLR